MIDGQLHRWCTAEMMNLCSDLTDPSNGPLEFAVMRGCIGFQIIKLNSAGIFFCFKDPWIMLGKNNTVPSVLKCERWIAGCASNQSIAVELKCKRYDIVYNRSPQISLHVTDVCQHNDDQMIAVLTVDSVSGGVHAFRGLLRLPCWCLMLKLAIVLQHYWQHIHDCLISWTVYVLFSVFFRNSSKPIKMSSSFIVYWLSSAIFCC